MPTTADYLNQLIDDKADLVAILNAKGVTASDTETFTELVPKVDTIPSGGGGNADGSLARPFIADLSINFEVTI